MLKFILFNVCYNCIYIFIIIIILLILLLFLNVMGIGDWGLGDWGLGPIPNPQSPIPINKIIIIIKI